ncbi:hypothetical protein PRZ48_015203 [Zasmidium cellare]|uniref:Uncharacterized protein n=1 Tax=Zasmidium cellare TaxID=395010 RepID=A0ABR0DXZ9_ZASCE|nr:hypothetical protein PRZ48_015203 [Zasmidium cellare]
MLWRLGGLKSSFEVDGFNFSRQHDTQWISFNDDVEIITFLENASDNFEPPYKTGHVSSGLLVELDKRTMGARVLKRWIRPDQKLSQLRGNMQNLPGGNVLLGWSDNAYITGHSADGELLAEGRFTSERFVTYRSYKFNFTGLPAEAKPVLRALAHGAERKKSSTAIYTSWKGATDIASWEYFCGGLENDARVIGKTACTGFETTFYTSGCECEEIFAKAVNKNGALLGTSHPSVMETLKHWKHDEEHDDGGGIEESVKSEL